MLNLQICTVIIMTKKDKKKKKYIKKSKKKKKKKLCCRRDSNSGHMGSKSPNTSITPWRPMQDAVKNNQYILK